MSNLFVPRDGRVVHRYDFLVKSDDRLAGTAANDAEYQLPAPLIGQVSVRLKWLQMFNSFPNVLTGVNDTFVYDVGGSNTITFPEGFWVSGEGRITYAESQVDLNTFTNDVRYFLLREDGGTNMNAVTLRAETGRLEIEWAAPTSYDAALSNTDWMHLDNNTAAAANWVGDDMLDLSGVSTIALEAVNLGDNNAIRDTYAATSVNNYMCISPVLAPFSDSWLYEPLDVDYFVPFRTEGRPLSRFRIRVVDPVTRLPIHVVKYHLCLTFESTNLCQ